MRTIATLAIVATLAATAAAGEIDLTSIRAHASGQAAQTSGRTRRAYAALDRALTRSLRPGLRGDFRALRIVASATERRLADDEILAGSILDALGDGLAALGDARRDLVELAAALDSASDRARCGAASAAAGVLASKSTTARNLGRTVDCSRLGRRAARGYDAGVALATRLLGRQDAREPAWSVPLEDLGGALLAVFVEPGPAPAVYAVGAADTDGPVFLRMGGEGWVRVPVAADGDLWWVAGIGESVFAAGTGGRVVRYAPLTGGVSDMSTGVDVTLYGVWGSSETDVWAVGGNAVGAGLRSALLHSDGTGWTSVELPAGTNDRTLFKVWGSAADDVWACGQAGLLLHFDGDAWSVVESGTFESLFTVHGTSPTVAVGGTVQPSIAERSGQGFLSATVPVGSESLRGVFVPGSGDAWACGLSSAVLRRTSSRWSVVTGVPAAAGRDFHAVAVDDAGGVYLAGGNLVTMNRGALVYFGPRRIPVGVYRQAKLRDRVQPMLYLSCGLTGCHVAPFISEDLDLGTADATHAGNVGTQSRQSPLLRVLPGRPSQSYLWHKVLGSQTSVGGSGTRMPQGDAGLPADDRDALRAWILEGARDN